MFAAGWRHLSHRDGLCDDLNPRLEHAEAVIQWQLRVAKLMWEGSFGLALWHSGDSGHLCPSHRLNLCQRQTAAHRIVMPGHGVASGFDLISAIRSSKMRKKVATIVQHRSAASTVQRSITVAEAAVRA